MPAYTDSATTQANIGTFRNTSLARRDRAFRGYSTVAPTTGTYAQGDFVVNSLPVATSGTLGWVCVTAGTPGTWVAWPGTITKDVIWGMDDLGTGTDKSIDFSTGFKDKKYNLSGSGTLTLTGPVRKSRYSLLLQSTTATHRDVTWAGDTTLAPGSFLPTYITNHPTLLIMEWRESRWHVRPPNVAYITIDLSTISGTWSIDCGNVHTKFRCTNSLPTGVTFAAPTNLPIGSQATIEFITAQANPPSYSGFIKSTSDASHAAKTRYEVKHTQDTYWLEMLDQV